MCGLHYLVGKDFFMNYVKGKRKNINANLSSATLTFYLATYFKV